MTRIAARIEAKLTETFTPARLLVRDDSERHRGHAGYREGGETHFHVEIVSDAFDGLSRVARQRAVYQALAEELAERVHALELVVRTPAEAASG